MLSVRGLRQPPVYEDEPTEDRSALRRSGGRCAGLGMMPRAKAGPKAVSLQRPLDAIPEEAVLTPRFHETAGGEGLLPEEEFMPEELYEEAAEWSDLLDDAGEEAEREMMAEELRQARMHAAEDVEPHVSLNLEGGDFAAGAPLEGELHGIPDEAPEEDVET